MRVKLTGLTKTFGPVRAVDRLTLEIHDGEFVALLGPSGCGKTTTLLMLAGIYRPSVGKIEFDDTVVNWLPPRDRNIGMVFQSYALYPHMTVYQNLTFPLVLQKRPHDEIRTEALRLARMLGLQELLDRKPSMLSGGQQQRVALGRALIKRPNLLLFDEPLSNLDAALRLSMRAEIKRLQKELGITSVYVTHDQVEAMTMADRIALLNGGILEAYATPETLHDCPKTLFVARFVGSPPMNILDVELSGQAGAVVARLGNLSLPVPFQRRPKVPTGAVKMGIRPQDLALTRDDGEQAEVYVVEPMGRESLVTCSIGAWKLRVLADPDTLLRIGDTVRVRFDMQRVYFFDAVTGQSLLEY